MPAAATAPGKCRITGNEVMLHIALRRAPHVPGLPRRRLARVAGLAAGAAVVVCGGRAALLAAEEGVLANRTSSRERATALHELAGGAAVLTHGRLFWRAAWLIWSFSLALLLSPAAFFSRSFCERVYYRVLYEAIVYSRSAALTKWSQWASVRLDLFPATLCLLLTRLQSDAPTHPLAHTLAELESAGISLVDGAGHVDSPKGSARRASGGVLEALAGLEEKPLASGSIAQVHAAHCAGKRVVVKVRHPKVDEELLLDLELLRRAATVAHEWLPSLRWLNAPQTLAQFEVAMSGQCDLSQEAKHLEAFRVNFRRKAAWMVFPQVLFASPAVLVETYEAGELATDFVRRGTEVARAEAQFVIARGEDAYLQMLLVDNFMHADLHPGNLVFRRAGLLGKPQLVLLDAGMAAHLTDDERRNFIGLLQAIGDGNGQAVATCVLRFSRQGSSNPAAFTAEVQAMCAESCRGYGTGIDVGAVIREMMQLMYRHSVSIDGNYATLIANLLCLEGMARELEPRFNVMDVAYPLLRAHQLLGDRHFQQAFYIAQFTLPLSVWELTYRLALYSALNGEYLKRFQI